MASTPPPALRRARTPPTPLHGPLHDNYEPYSPRRSKRTAAHSNPYGSASSERLPKINLQRATTPPPTGKKARFASTQLSSPPSSPASPQRRPAQHKTPRKTPVSRAFADVLSDSDNTPRRQQLPTPLSVLPTPSKTPKKRSAATMNSTARILNFQPHSPSDVMPSPRKMKKPAHARSQSSRGFELFEDGTNSSQEQIQIFTDSNARIPELDGSEDNPLVGPRQTRAGRPQRSARTDEEVEFNDRVSRDEGIVYSFRGKKIFRRFAGDDQDDGNSSPDLAQRSLRRQAGIAAERPLTRSSIKPRLLFPSEDQLREREEADASDEVDEEALTDIELPVSVKKQPTKTATPRKAAASHLATPPSTKRTKRVVDTAPGPVPSLEMVVEEPEDAPASPVTRKATKAKNRSPFDDWPRLKAPSSSSSRGKKRTASESVEPADDVAPSSKRTRSGAVASPS